MRCLSPLPRTINDRPALSATTSSLWTRAISPRRSPHSAPRRIMSFSDSVAFSSAALMYRSGHGLGCACGFFTLGTSWLGSSARWPLLRSQRKNDEMVLRYALRVSGFHCCRAKTCTICSVVTSSGPDGMSSAARCTILYRRLLIVCADRPAALRVSVHPLMLLRHGTGALILFLMIHHAPLALSG